MSANNDAAFLRMFLLVLGALVVFTITVMFTAGFVSSDLNSKLSGDSRLQAAITERIKPIGKVEIAQAGATASAVAESAPKTAPAVATPAVEPVAGKSTYDSACFACHGTGAAGAPKLGDKAAWVERIAPGMETMVANAINGKGSMPPKGGRMDLSDDAVKAAVVYMLEASQ